VEEREDGVMVKVMGEGWETRQTILEVLQRALGLVSIGLTQQHTIIYHVVLTGQESVKK